MREFKNFWIYSTMLVLCSYTANRQYNYNFFRICFRLPLFNSPLTRNQSSIPTVFLCSLNVFKINISHLLSFSSLVKNWGIKILFTYSTPWWWHLFLKWRKKTVKIKHSKRGWFFFTKFHKSHFSNSHFRFFLIYPPPFPFVL